ncbi:hypothetical protein ACHWQZ_G010436 [Mnemiopsis leidyi]
MIIENKLTVGGEVGNGLKKPRTYKIDEVLEHFGSIGKFQIYLILLCTCIGLVAPWRILFDIFAAKPVPWKCTTLGKSISDGCKFEEGKMPCAVEANADLESRLRSGEIEGMDKNAVGAGLFWEFDKETADHSIRSTMMLSCSDDWKFSFASSIYFIGAFFGVWMFGSLSDMLGRRITCMISLGMCIGQAWIIPFFNNITVYLACRFFDGAAFGGFFLIAFVLEVEYAPPKYRNRVGSAFHFITSVGMATVAIWGVIFKPWKAYAIALAIPPTIMLPVCYFLLPESARYYLGKGDDQSALTMLQKVADVNGKTIPAGCQLYEEVDEKTGVRDLLKRLSNGLLIRCALINMFGWFMTSLVYYMLWFSAKSLAGDIYVNAAILGIAEIPGRAVAFVLMDKIGRKFTFMGSIGVGCVCMFVSIHDNPVSRKVMYCIGKAVSAALWAVIYLYSSEMYPTKIRNLGSGIGSAAARVAALIAPFIGDWLEVSPIVPYILVGVLAIVCSGIFMFVPETSGKDLPQTLEDFELLFEDKKDKGEDEQL